MNAALSVGWAPNQLSFYEEDMVSPDDMGDTIARIVMERFRNSSRAKANNIIYQGKSTIRLLREADQAMEKTYTPGMVDNLVAAFESCPERYYGLSAAKTVAIANWRAELVAQDPGSLIQITPTPNPRLPQASQDKIKEQVKQELIARMMASGIGDPKMLMSVSNNRLHGTVKAFLDEKASLLRRLEQAKAVSSAKVAATQIQNRIRDAVTEGGFIEAYSRFSFNQIKYGVGVLRFPYWQRQVVLSTKQNFKGAPERSWKTIPMFRDVSPHNFFPMNDGRDASDNTGNSEYREVNKTALVSMTKDSRYNADVIMELLDQYSMGSRTWMFPESSNTETETGQSSTYWGPDEVVAVIYHEGWMTGRDLQAHGLTGYDATEVYDVSAEVCLGRTIRVEVKNPLAELPRSYAITKYEDLGHGVFNAVGVPAILANTQDRINLMLRVFEDNLDWSLRPPLQTNSESLKNPHEARMIRPGGRYEVSDMIGPGSSPDPIRTIRGPSAQYQIVWPLILQLIRQADSECGVPDMSDFSSLGKGSLGEFSARVSAAVRRIRASAFAEDRGLKPMWRTLFEHVLTEEPELAEGADLDMNYVGIVGLLGQKQEREAKVERLSLIMQAVQSGNAPTEVAKYAYQELLEDMGVPTDSLGMSNPLIDNSIANAIGTRVSPAGSEGAVGVPQLDGRSGGISNVPTAVAAPNGGSQIVPPPGA